MIPWVIKSFRGGMSDENNKGIPGSFKNGYNLDIHKDADTLSCNYQMKEISSGVLEDLVKFFVIGADSSMYAFGDGGRIYSKSTDSITDNFVKRHTDSNGAIKGASNWSVSAGNDYLFWATDTSLARKEMITPNSGMDWGNVEEDWSTTLKSADWHTMQRACGSMIIANDMYLALMGFDGSYNPEAMNIEPGQKIKCLEERDDYVIMGSYNIYDDSGYIWSWITSADNYIQKNRLPVSKVNALISTEIMIAQGGSEGSLVYSDFTDTVPLHAFKQKGETYPGAVAIMKGLAIFGVFNSDDNLGDGLWTYGRVKKNRPRTLNWEHKLSVDMLGSSVSELGAVIVNDGIPFVSWKTIDGSTVEFGIDYMDTSTRAEALCESLEFDGGVPHLKKRFESAKLIIEPLPAGCSIAYKYKMNRGSWQYAMLADASGSSFTTEGATEVEFIINAEGYCAEIGTLLTPNGLETPEVRSITTYLDDTMDLH